MAPKPFPPPDSWLTLNSTESCEIASKWLVGILKQTSKALEEASINDTWSYVSAVTPANVTSPLVGEAVTWYWNVTTFDPADMMLFHAAYDCGDELCLQLDWEGDPDLAGLGMMATYYLAAALSTTYFLLLSLIRVRTIADKLSSPRWTRCIEAIDGSLSTFIDTALLFAISMLVAATYRHGSSRIHPIKTHSWYGLINSAYLSVFTLFPPLVLQTVAKDLRRRRIRLSLWFLAIAFALTASGMFYDLSRSPNRQEKLLESDEALTDYLWLYNCYPKTWNVVDGVAVLMYIGQSLLGLNIAWWIHCAATAFLLDRQKSLSRKSLPEGNKLMLKLRKLYNDYDDFTKPNVLGRIRRLVNRWIKFLNGLVCCAIMWALLVQFTAFRSSLKDIMGDPNLDSQWSFGQVLALATWVPVAIDFITICLYGELEAFEGKLPEGFGIVPMPSNSNDKPIPDEEVPLAQVNTSYPGA